MELITESSNLNDYLVESDIINFSHPLIKSISDKLFHDEQSEIEKAKTAFEFVRDNISHSWDIQGTNVTCKASDVLQYKEGICFAKSNLLVALLRSQGIPTGFCYQRLMLFDTPERGYSLHAFNGIYLESFNRWIRVDARGNKSGVEAEFSIDKEKLAFFIRKEFNEKDYPTIYTSPNEKTILTLKTNTNAIEMYMAYLPDDL